MVVFRDRFELGVLAARTLKGNFMGLNLRAKEKAANKVCIASH